MANIQSLWSNKRAIPKKGGTLEVDGLTMLNAKLDALTKRMDKMNISALSSSALSSCEFCQGGHTIECQFMYSLSLENMNYLGNFNKGE